MTYYGMVRFVMVWFEMAWQCKVWHGIELNGLVWCGLVPGVSYIIHSSFLCRDQDIGLKVKLNC